MFNLKFLFIPVLCVYSFSYVCGTYETWTPSNGPAKSLWCNTTLCNGIDESKVRCCPCNSIPDHEYKKETIFDLDIEYTDFRGKADIVNTNETYYDSNLHKFSVTHKMGYLRYFPTNICSFKYLIHIRLSYNRIQSIGDISCMKNLEVLDLGGNQIQTVPNSTFLGLSSLLEINLSNNNIISMDPNTISDKSIGALYYDFSKNPLQSFDISNILIEREYCYLDFAESITGDMTNQHAVYVDENKVYGSGNISFVNASTHLFTQLLNANCSFRNSLLNNFPSGTWDYEGVTLDCDCQLEPLLELHQDTFKRFFSKVVKADWNCTKPKTLAETNALSIPHNQEKLDLMVCNIQDGCPLRCVCTDQPSRRRLIVNCTGQRYTSLPLFMPQSCNNLELYFGGNSIKELKTRSYFHRVSVLDLSNNAVEKINSTVPTSLPVITQIILKGHALTDIPKSFQVLHPDVLVLGEKGIDCDCNNIWVGEWRRIKVANKSNPLYCQLSEEDKRLSEDIVSGTLECGNDDSFTTTLSIAFPIVITISSIIIITCLFFNQEILILTRKLRHRKMEDGFIYDVFVSFSEEEADVRYYVLKELYPKLQALGYKLYIPCIDLPFGDKREHTTVKIAKQCKSSIIILSEKYGTNDAEWSRMEFNQCLRLYLKSRTRTFIIVNFGNFSKSKSSLSVKPLFRLRRVLKLSDRHTKIFEKIVTELGDPERSKDHDGNKREGTVFRRKHLKNGINGVKMIQVAESNQNDRLDLEEIEI